MHVHAIKTHIIEVGESIFSILDKDIPCLQEGSIVALTSKIISICQNRVIPITDTLSKRDLIKQECDAFLSPGHDNPYNVYLTITNNILIPTAGIDESNGNGHYILYPQDIQEVAFSIWEHLRHRDQIKDLGVIITDSHTTPLRRGVTGISLGWCGFSPLYNYIGKEDIHGNHLCVTQTNILDALAVSAVFMMGEGSEQTPLAIITDAPRIEFLSRPPTIEETEIINIPISEDLYGPLLASDKWEWKIK